MGKGELATAAGISAPYVTQLERGEHPERSRSRPSIATLRALGTALEVDPRAFYIEPGYDRLIEEAVEKINGDRAALDLAIDVLVKVRDSR